MKISKYNHTKSAVAKKNKGAEIGGILYQNPGRVIDLGKRLNSKNRSVQILYNFFVPIQAGVAPSEPKAQNDEFKRQNYEIKKANYDLRVKYEKTIGGLNKCMKDICVDRKTKLFLNNETIFCNISDSAGINNVDGNEVVILALRRSLEKEKEGAIRFIDCLGKKLSDADMSIIKPFIELARKDYGKLSEGSDVIDKLTLSIENQNIAVQPIDSVLVSPIPPQSGKKTNHKQEEKQGFNLFLSDYANIDETCRMGQLRKLRRLVELYFDIPIEIGDFNVWERHEQGKLLEGNFVEIPEVLINAYENDKKLNQIEKNEAIATLKASVETCNMNSYRRTLTTVREDKEGLYFERDEVNKFWIHHIENAVTRLTSQRLDTSLFKLKKAYLTEKVWKDILNYISIKFIATGKAVYHFAMDDLLDTEKDVELGVISEKAIEGITSFDYEIIKANETLQRETAVQVAFAANNLSRAVIDVKDFKTSDLLSLNGETLKTAIKPGMDSYDIVKAVMQFFGGQSKWDIEMIKKAYNKEDYGYAFLNDLRTILFEMRNETFHFKTAGMTTNNWNMELIGAMFCKEAKDSTIVMKNKLYSNNLPMFYDTKDLEKALNSLYSAYTERASQVPAFNKVLVRRDFATVLSDNIRCKAPSNDKETLEKWRSAVYFLFKEIYYCVFLQDKNAKNCFYNAIKKIKDTCDEADIKAVENFSERCKTLRDGYSLSQICQQIITEYNAQNNGQRMTKTAKDSFNDHEIFKHYKLLLMKALCTAFCDYVTEGEFSFIKNPVVREMPVLENFLPNWESGMYNDLINEVNNNAELQKWYVVGHFLNGRVLSHLNGSLRSYVQYVEDVNRRAKETDNKLIKREKELVARTRKAIEVLDMCTRLNDTFTNNFNDYFGTNEDYTKYLSQFVDMDGTVEELNKFCNPGSENYGIYMDGVNPIMNRNVLMAKLFGPDQVLKNVVPRVTQADVKTYYALKTKLGDYELTGVIRDKAEQEKVIAFQKQKNRVELSDLSEYGEIINELLGQLINWSFMRERDLLYFQLGFHYTCLHNASKKPEGYVTLQRKNGKVVQNAILNQIASMYIYGVEMLGVDRSGTEKMQTSAKIGLFLKYTDTLNVSNDREFLYNAGLEVFENIKEHDNIIPVRNAIDHFHFYSATDDIMSIMDMYGEVFDRFFTYDMKYQKNVVNSLGNILANHFVIMDSHMGTKTNGKLVGKTLKNRADIIIDKLEADKFTFKTVAGKVDMSARDEVYLKNIASLLYYPQKAPNIKLVCHKYENVTKAGSTNSQSKNFGNNKNYNRKSNNRRPENEEDFKKYQESKKNEGGIGSGLMADLLKGWRN